jgi:hypothetical protein
MLHHHPDVDLLLSQLLALTLQLLLLVPSFQALLYIQRLLLVISHVLLLLLFLLVVLLASAEFGFQPLRLLFLIVQNTFEFQNLILELPKG